MPECDWGPAKYWQVIKKNIKEEEINFIGRWTEDCDASTCLVKNDALSKQV